MTRRDIVILGLGCALLGVALLRVLLPGEAATRQISIEEVQIKSQPIKSGESLSQEASWTPPDDVFIIGWAPRVGAPTALPNLYLLSQTTTIFFAPRSADGFTTTFFPAKTGFLVRKGEQVTLRLHMINAGADGETKGARALIYFHPVPWR